MNILLAGGSGTIGQKCQSHFQKNGWNTAILTRNPQRHLMKGMVYGWDTTKGIMEDRALEWADVIINFCGVGIADKPWTNSRKKAIIDSRIQPTNLLFRKIMNHHISAFLQFSANGYYGMHDQKIFDETANAGNDFLADVCQQWEAPAHYYIGDALVSILRIAVVLDNRSGMLSKLLPSFKMGLPLHIGHGNQMLSWIHIDDIPSIMSFIIKKRLKGTFNLSSPNPIRFKDFSRELNDVLRMKRSSFGIPSWMIRTVFGEMSSLLIKGQEIYPGSIKEHGYTFLFPSVKKAIKNLVLDY